MNTYLKLSSVKTDNQNCNCITPFYIDNITGINPNTGRNYSNEDKDAMKTALYRVSNAKGCKLNVCCDANDPTSMPDPVFTKKFLKRFPKIMPVYERSTLKSIKLSTNKDITGDGWVEPSAYMICKISKSTITDTTDPNIKLAINLVNDCFTNQCSNIEQITVNNLLQNSKADMKYTYIDDARVSQAIREGNISYVKEYIAKYKVIDLPLTNDDYNNRMIHIASESSNVDILNMLIALKANLNIKNKINETPIHFAVRSKNIDNIDTLLSQGVDMSLSNIKGETPMFYAMTTGNLRIIKMLYNNNSPILNVDKEGNNLIHYCVKNCPSFKNSEETEYNKYTKDNTNGDKNDKSEIIKFLIERGINTEQLNVAGLTTLELTQKEINREINKECAEDIQQDTADINEYFFNIKPVREAFSNSMNNTSTSTSTTLQTPLRPSPSTTKFTSGAQTRTKDISGYTLEHKELLEIQTLLFNNAIRNNPKKYSGYISVDDIPKGSPIEVLDTVCVGNGMTGNEDSDECIANGGQIVKIKNRTTKIKLELLPEEETQIDAVNDKDLYFPKQPKKIPKGTIPSEIQDYNNTITNQVPQTTGITYNIGEISTNEITNTNSNSNSGFNPQPTKASVNNATNSNTITNNNKSSEINTETISAPSAPSPTLRQLETTNKTTSDHPPLFDEYDDFVHKCQKDAIRNSEKIAEIQTTIPQITQITQATINSFTDKYKIPLISLSVFIIVLIIGIIIYNINY